MGCNPLRAIGFHGIRIPGQPLSRASLYYRPCGETAKNLELMRRSDREYTEHPFPGSRRMCVWLRSQGHAVNRKRVQRLYGAMGPEAIYPKPRLSAGNRAHTKYPYLLRNSAIERPDRVWSADITRVPMPCGFMYLAAAIDWYSRYVVSWRSSNSLDGSFCFEMLEESLSLGTSEIFNTDRGSGSRRGRGRTGGTSGNSGEYERPGSMPRQLWSEQWGPMETFTATSPRSLA